MSIGILILHLLMLWWIIGLFCAVQGYKPLLTRQCRQHRRQHRHLHRQTLQRTVHRSLRCLKKARPLPRLALWQQGVLPSLVLLEWKTHTTPQSPRHRPRLTGPDAVWWNARSYLSFKFLKFIIDIAHCAKQKVTRKVHYKAFYTHRMTSPQSSTTSSTTVWEESSWPEPYHSLKSSSPLSITSFKSLEKLHNLHRSCTNFQLHLLYSWQIPTFKWVKKICLNLFTFVKNMKILKF